MPIPRPGRPVLAVVLGGLVVLGIALAWRYTALSEIVTPERLRHFMAAAKGAPWAVLVVMLVFVLAGAMVFPLNILILATAAVFGPWLGMLYGAAGILSSGLCMFAVGAMLGRRALERLLAERWRRGLLGLRRRGLVTVVTFRLLPIVPFTLVNLAAGASGIRFTDFLFGTLIGMLPGLVILSIMGDRIVALVANPTIGDIAILVACVTTLIGLAIAAQAVLARRRDRA
jgi:phospholipase D1/2